MRANSSLLNSIWWTTFVLFSGVCKLCSICTNYWKSEIILIIELLVGNFVNITWIFKHLCTLSGKWNKSKQWTIVSIWNCGSMSPTLLICQINRLRNTFHLTISKCCCVLFRSTWAIIINGVACKIIVFSKQTNKSSRTSSTVNRCLPCNIYFNWMIC